jgi:hypothetical protein
MRVEGEYIIKTLITKEKDVYCQLDGPINYGEWKEKERKEEKVINPEIEKIKKKNLDNEQIIKKIQEENEKRMKEFKEENERIQEKAHKQFLEMISSNKKSEDEITIYRIMMQEKEKRRREEDERRIKQEKDEEKRQKLEIELQEKKEKQLEKEKKRKYLEKLLMEIKNTAKNEKEEKKGECNKDHNEFKAGLVEENELIKEAVLSDSDSVYKTEWKFGGKNSKTLEKTFTGKMIVGWKLKSDHENELGGLWERKSEVLGTSSYSFVVHSYPTRGCS